MVCTEYKMRTLTRKEMKICKDTGYKHTTTPQIIDPSPQIIYQIIIVDLNGKFFGEPWVNHCPLPSHIWLLSHHYKAQNFLKND